MTKADKDEIREIINDVVSIQNEHINGKLELINIELKQIKEQTTKTNGRVNKLEDKTDILKTNDIEHITHCPNVVKIQNIEKDLESQKSIKKFIVTSITIAGILITVIIELFKFLG